MTIIPSLDQLARTSTDIRAFAQSLPNPQRPRTAIYGTGFLGAWACTWLKDNGFDLVACFDGNPERAGTQFQGLPVHAPEEIGEIGPELTLITARHAIAPVRVRLETLGVASLSFDAFYAALHFEAFAAVHELLDDERSRDVLRAVLAAMLTGEKHYCEAVFEKDQYFCLPRFCGVEKEIFIDAGAYVGDSVERFIWTHYGVFTRIHAFEPGARQHRALKTRTDRLIEEWALDPTWIVINRSGLGAGEAQMASASQSGQLQSLALGSTTDAGPGAVSVTSLDRYLDGAPASFIKADVEGMEMALLKGATETITRCRPKLAICVYHYPSDIPQISSYLKSLVPDYRFALRHHSPQLMETVLYAWAE
ncbi:MAG: FkbM family methyltransferase [Arenimonas sp.]|nr:FkbM family methyltransferase [Arenimonas sp.]